ncbi:MULTISPECIES: hypothetical protein [Bacillus]|uniref:hypothetical protein n=1 Tax=Bacillus TaxID=1386 RepID=UPI0002DDFB48|nr:MULTISPECIES: hypothetical protein [Bacillus]
MGDIVQKKITNFFIKVPTNVVRNDGYELKNGAFVLYVNLVWNYFINKSTNKSELILDHKSIMLNCKISDTRTFKRRLNELYNADLIKNEITRVPPRGTIVIHFNEEKYLKECEKNFTKVGRSILTYYKNGQIDDYSLRQIFYYMSHINRKTGNDYCFVSFETLSDRLMVSKDKISEANEMLEKAKLIKIKKHKLAPTSEYDEFDALVYDRYQNHYYVDKSMF